MGLKHAEALNKWFDLTWRAGGEGKVRGMRSRVVRGEKLSGVLMPCMIVLSGVSSSSEPLQTHHLSFSFSNTFILFWKKIMFLKGFIKIIIDLKHLCNWNRLSIKLFQAWSIKLILPVQCCNINWSSEANPQRAIFWSLHTAVKYWVSKQSRLVFFSKF